VEPRWGFGTSLDELEAELDPLLFVPSGILIEFKLRHPVDVVSGLRCSSSVSTGARSKLWYATRAGLIRPII
jgi:hypothetical protein